MALHGIIWYYMVILIRLEKREKGYFNNLPVLNTKAAKSMQPASDRKLVMYDEEVIRINKVYTLILKSKRK